MSKASKISPAQAAAILREVPPEKAFHFYRAIDKPLNVSARSLREFIARVDQVETASIAFHSERRDFENWISMLGDSELTKRLAALRATKLQGEALRARLSSATKNRVEQLARLSTNAPH
jgi:Family of unknown function (DUF5752)